MEAYEKALSIKRTPRVLYNMAVGFMIKKRYAEAAVFVVQMLRKQEKSKRGWELLRAVVDGLERKDLVAECLSRRVDGFGEFE
jgi:hypothetical protein